MFKTILIALDGTPEAEAVVPTARAMARARYAELLLVRITDNYHTGAAKNVAASRYLEDLIRQYDLGGLRVRTEIRYGEAAEQIVAAAIEARAELIAMASHGRHGIARAWFGSVTERVLADSPVPVLVLSANGNASTRFRKLLVPIDLAPGQDAALDVARDIAVQTDAHLQLLHVVAPPREGSDPAVADEDDDLEDRRATARAHLDKLVAQFFARAVAATGEVASGPVAETIARAAREGGSDLIVMGTRARTGPRRALLGSVADEVVRTAGRPVILIRQGAVATRAMPAAEVAAVD